MDETRFETRTIFQGTLAGTGAWVALPFQNETERTVQGTLTAGDTIDIDVSLNGVIASPVTSFTGTPFAAIVAGAWSHIRARKTGATGIATVLLRG